MDSIPGINVSVPPSGPGCLECTEQNGWWYHLRRCAECGHSGCCDNSLGRHATAHEQQTGHMIIRSYEPGEDWFWNYADSSVFAGPALAPPEHHPLTQSVPGPADRVPPDWQEQLG